MEDKRFSLDRKNIHDNGCATYKEVLTPFGEDGIYS